MEGGKEQGYFVAPEGASNVLLGACMHTVGRMCRSAADTARDIFVGLRLGVGVSALGMRKITVVLRAIEIGLRAAVGRFLISREKSGSRSVDFYAVGVWKKRVPGAVQVYSGSSSVDSGGRVVIPHSRACLGV